jgi:hypothetical protein
MRSESKLRFPLALATLCGMVLVGGIFTSRVRADEWNKMTILTVDQPIQIYNTYLDPGKYVLKLMDSQSDRHIVEIFNGDQTHLINTVLAIPNYRLEPTGRSQFVFWETPPGYARALRAWFYPGDNFGQEFLYPKNLREIAMVSQAAPPPAPAPEAAPAPAPETPAPQAEATPAPAPEQPEVAENAPPPEQPAPEPAPQPAPQELPKTASPYPMIGLGGMLALALYGLLRVKRLA